ncbi:sodium:proton antiporter [Seongchinamella sediminis]|uniref:Sodium:proton antiporter n=2 Tax=Seongchinamella sediminis TaxID=2283635 RepID=A0A3L7DXP3_9GAMM|nr:sodium:proton antiporter [Seongchinamella sediminis]
MASWLLWSGLFKPLLIGLGVFSCLLSLWLAKRMGAFRHAMPLRALLRLPALWWWVLKEVVQSSLEVTRVVLSPSLPIQPSVIELSSSEKTDSGKVILGNSITLSPGTVTIDVHENRLLVHCLTANSARGLRSGEAERRVAKLGLD